MPQSPAKKLLRPAIVFVLVVPTVVVTVEHSRRRLTRLVQRFEDYSGTQLVFDRRDLPPGHYHDVLQPLPASRHVAAAAICLQEAKKYPPGYLRRAGLKAFGVFAACASETGDGFRAYDADLGGYPYYGIWNEADACAAAYYTDRQLRLTFHHEIFHHLAAACGRGRGPERAGDRDARYRAALTGQRSYSPPVIRPGDFAALKRVSAGEVLTGAVSDYAEKTISEDQAETSRYFLTTLADGLVQVVEHPELPGSQRILSCLEIYRSAVDDGPGIDWFVDVALGRAKIRVP